MKKLENENLSSYNTEIFVASERNQNDENDTSEIKRNRKNKKIYPNNLIENRREHRRIQQMQNSGIILLKI
jgi:hypothetical protein